MTNLVRKQYLILSTDLIIQRHEVEKIKDYIAEQMKNDDKVISVPPGFNVTTLDCDYIICSEDDTPIVVIKE